MVVNKDLDVVLLQHNQASLTLRFLDSIKGFDRPRVILIDNGSDDRQRELARKALHRRDMMVINQSNLGFAKAVNQGLCLTTRKFVCIQNNDTIMSPDGYKRMIRWLISHPRLGCVGPMTNKAMTLQQTNDFKAEDKLQLTDGLLAFFCAVFPTQAMRSIGLLNEDFGMGYGEDDDYCLRLRNRGWNLGIARDVFVHHDHHATYLQTIGEAGIEREGQQGLAKLREMYGEHVFD